MENLIGQRFDRLLVTGIGDRSIPRRRYWLCKCDCGVEKQIRSDSLKNGVTQSCGCLGKERRIQANTLDISNQRFGRLVALEIASNEKLKGNIWKCICDCGNYIEIPANPLRSGHTRSCGCFHKDRAREVAKIHRFGNKRATIHGLSNSPEYNCWEGMIQRCRNPKSNRYSSYGGRGIKVCDRWLKFENFYSDMGSRPEGLTLDRIDVNGDYCPDNCRWITNLEQQNNRRDNVLIEFQGKVQTIADWSRELNLTYSILRGRLDRGWTVEKAFTTPKKAS